MKLWLIEQNSNVDYDTYDSAVVAANTEKEAQYTHPSVYATFGDYDKNTKKWTHKEWNGYEETNSWTSVDNVTAQYLGEAAPDTKKGVICASFNAG